jgi:hypothetical protein
MDAFAAAKGVTIDSNDKFIHVVNFAVDSATNALSTGSTALQPIGIGIPGQ